MTTVDPDGPAAKNGLEPGMVILNIGTRPVRNAAVADQMAQNAKKNGQILLLVKIPTSSSNIVQWVSVPVGVSN